jgi:hypothetical protein
MRAAFQRGRPLSSLRLGPASLQAANRPSASVVIGATRARRSRNRLFQTLFPEQGVNGLRLPGRAPAYC